MISRDKKRPKRQQRVSSNPDEQNNTNSISYEYDELIYEPLDPLRQEIRILTILGHGDNDLECDIEHVALQDAPPFTACSYTWSSDVKPRKVKIRGRWLGVGQTLWDFLLYLKRGQGIVKIWADAICINQSDNSEKSIQVFMMAEIFNRAERVISWLGDSNHNCRMALNYIRQAKEQLQSGSRKQKIERDKYTLTKRKTMRDLIDRKYWTRLWIIQETVRAKSLWVTTGDGLISWDDIRYWISQEYLDSSHCLNEWDTAQKMYLAIVAMRDGGGQSIPLPELIDSFSDAACIHQHDKLYGLVALTEPAVRQNFIFDYSSPFFEVLLRNFHHWASTSNMRRQESIETSKMQRRTTYTVSEVVGNLRKLYHPDELDTLRRQNKPRKRLAGSLAIKSMVLSQKTVYHVFATIEKSRIDYLKGQICDLSPGYIVTIEPPITFSNGSIRADIIYSTVIPKKMDILLIAGHTCFFVRKHGPSFTCVGSGLMVKSDCKSNEAPDPITWLAHIIPNIGCEIVPNTWAIGSGRSDTITCHVEYNGLAVAEIYKNENKSSTCNGTPQPTWDLAACIAKLGLQQESPGTVTDPIKSGSHQIDNGSHGGTYVTSDPGKLNEIKMLLNNKTNRNPDG